MVPNNHASGSTEIIGIKPLKLPADYVDQAETIIVGFSSSKKRRLHQHKQAPQPDELYLCDLRSGASADE